jgi:hypothetical protein
VVLHHGMVLVGFSFSFLCSVLAPGIWILFFLTGRSFFASSRLMFNPIDLKPCHLALALWSAAHP